MRKAALNARRSMRAGEIAALSARVQENLKTIPQFLSSRTLACYAATKDEVQTEKIIREALAAGKSVLVPVTRPSTAVLVFSDLHDFDLELAPGRFGILEPREEFLRPVPLESADVILVPLLAWDERGYRIGYGMGYFDRALRGLQGPLTVGLAFEAQRVAAVPETENDVRLKALATEKRVIRFSTC